MKWKTAEAAHRKVLSQDHFKRQIESKPQKRYT